MKEQFKFMNNAESEKRTRRMDLNHKITMKSIVTDKILAEYGNYTELLPDELKIFGKDKGYRKGS